MPPRVPKAGQRNGAESRVRRKLVPPAQEAQRIQEHRQGCRGGRGGEEATKARLKRSEGFESEIKKYLEAFGRTSSSSGLSSSQMTAQMKAWREAADQIMRQPGTRGRAARRSTQPSRG
jgi:hypothetical protein